MKGERTTKRLGVETNKTLKRDPYGHQDYKIEQLRVQVQNKLMHESPEREEIVQPLCDKCSKSMKIAKQAFLD